MNHVLKKDSILVSLQNFCFISVVQQKRMKWRYKIIVSVRSAEIVLAFFRNSYSFLLLG